MKIAGRRNSVDIKMLVAVTETSSTIDPMDRIGLHTSRLK
jgi:hypothetical protein